VETEMPAAGIVPNDRTHSVFEKTEELWSRMRTKRLADLTKTGTPKARQQAQTLFKVLKVNGVADVFHWTLMQKLCDTSAEQQVMMEEMAAAGVQPSVMTYTTLVYQLMFEGNIEEARAMVETEMPAAGIVPNDRTHSEFEKTEEVWSRMRTKRLVDLTKTGTPEARQQAQTLFKALKVNGVANEFHWTLMQKLCDTSAEQRSMMEEMAAAGVQPDVVTYTSLANKLMFEGNAEEARAVVETRMPAAGVEPDDRTHSVFEKPEEEWSRMRTKHLVDLLKTNTPEARRHAQVFFEGLTGNRVADIIHCNVMVTEFPSAGIVSNDRTHSVPEEAWNRMRTKHLVDLTETGTPEARQQAQTFFKALKVNGVANEFHWTLMQKLCDTSAEQRVMMEEMAAAGVSKTGVRLEQRET